MIESLRLDSKRTVQIVRHDRTPGGTKRLVLPGVLHSLGRSGAYVYASPAYGYAQLALAYACAEIGAEAHVFLAARKHRTTVTQRAANAGAVLHPVRPGYLSVVQKRARDFALNTDAVLLPFGLHCTTMIDAIASLAQSLDIEPNSVWVTAGSGTLWQGLHKAWPRAEFEVVQVGKQIDTAWATGVDYSLHIAPENFAQDAKTRPPYKSASNYDAKAWQFIIKYAKDGALVWNTAG